MCIRDTDAKIEYMLGYLNNTETEAVNAFKEALTDSLGSRIRNLLLYGSKARGNYKPDSDIDIFILIDKSDPQTRKIVASATTGILVKYGILLSPKIIEEGHFSLIKQLGTAFARNIENEGIRI